MQLYNLTHVKNYLLTIRISYFFFLYIQKQQLFHFTIYYYILKQFNFKIKKNTKLLKNSTLLYKPILKNNFFFHKYKFKLNNFFFFLKQKKIILKKKQYTHNNFLKINLISKYFPTYSFIFNRNWNFLIGKIIPFFAWSIQPTILLPKNFDNIKIKKKKLYFKTNHILKKKIKIQQNSTFKKIYLNNFNYFKNLKINYNSFLFDLRFSFKFTVKIINNNSFFTKHYLFLNNNSQTLNNKSNFNNLDWFFKTFKYFILITKKYNKSITIKNTWKNYWLEKSQLKFIHIKPLKKKKKFKFKNNYKLFSFINCLSLKKNNTLNIYKNNSNSKTNFSFFFKKKKNLYKNHHIATFTLLNYFVFTNNNLINTIKFNNNKKKKKSLINLLNKINILNNIFVNKNIKQFFFKYNKNNFKLLTFKLKLNWYNLLNNFFFVNNKKILKNSNSVIFFYYHNWIKNSNVLNNYKFIIQNSHWNNLQQIDELFTKNEYDFLNFDENGFDSKGFNLFKLDSDSFNNLNLNVYNLNRQGLDPAGYDYEGFDHQDLNVWGVSRIEINAMNLKIQKAIEKKLAEIEEKKKLEQGADYDAELEALKLEAAAEEIAEYKALMTIKEQFNYSPLNIINDPLLNILTIPTLKRNPFLIINNKCELFISPWWTKKLEAELTHFLLKESFKKERPYKQRIIPLISQKFHTTVIEHTIPDSIIHDFIQIFNIFFWKTKLKIIHVFDTIKKNIIKKKIHFFFITKYIIKNNIKLKKQIHFFKHKHFVIKTLHDNVLDLKYWLNFNYTVYNSYYFINFLTSTDGFLYLTKKDYHNIFDYEEISQIKQNLYTFSQKNEIHKTIIKDYYKNNNLNLLDYDMILNNDSALNLFNEYDLKNNLTSNNSLINFNKNKFNLLTLNIESNKPVIQLLKMQKITDVDDLNIKKIKFKPGYQRMWRDSRFILKKVLNLNYKYQHKLTLYLTRLNKYLKFKILLTYEMTLINVLMQSRFLFYKNFINDFINNEVIYVNGKICLNSNFQLFYNDLIQFIVNLKYYIMYKTLLNYSLKKKLNFKRKIQTKLNSNAYLELFKKKSNVYPDWILYDQNMENDTVKYLEVDYFSLSIFIIYEPMFINDLNLYNLYHVKHNVINMYNWKYIT